ncbi:MAG TPA: LacI family DNA-binding transcriptional regulator [Tepidisphaeraceae bacterium]|nr:LacI family DNA-binding transcriptional regulator [Tepidisphaeraceae bacterium]
MSVTRIAARAGVSIATVSRVLNNSRRVKPEIADLVRAAMSELQYAPRRPRRRAKSAEPQKKTIAIVSLGSPYGEWFQIPVMAAVVAEVSRAAQEGHMGVLMAEMLDPEKLSPALRQQQVDGAIVVVPSALDPRVATALAQRIPTVRIMGAQFAAAEVDHVGADNNAIGHLAAEHLLSRACQRLAFITTRPAWDLSKQRGHGFAMAGLRDQRTTVCSLLVADDPELARFYGAGAVARATYEDVVDEAISRRADGIFVSRDEEVMQLYPLLRRRGVEPGRDVQVISCDNETVRLSMLHPRPASIELGTAEIGRRAVRRLELRMRHPVEQPVRILVNPQIVLPLSHQMQPV